MFLQRSLQRRGETHNICNRKKRGLTFNGELHKIEKIEENDITRFTIHIQTMTKDIREEVDLITTSGLIGSIGGFSFSGYALYLLDKCVSIFMTKLPQSD